MTNTTLTRADIRDSIHRDVGLSLQESAEWVDNIVDTLIHTLSKGEDVTIWRFGKFVVRQKGSRPGRNPRTREEVEITPRKVVSFRPSNLLRHNINHH